MSERCIIPAGAMARSATKVLKKHMVNPECRRQAPECNCSAFWLHSGIKASDRPLPALTRGGQNATGKIAASPASQGFHGVGSRLDESPAGRLHSGRKILHSGPEFCILDFSGSDNSFENRWLVQNAECRVQNAKPLCILEFLHPISVLRQNAECKKPCNYVTEGIGIPSVTRSPPSPRPLAEGQSGAGVSVLALDLGTQTGWALLSTDTTITSGSETFKPGRFEGGGMRFLRFKRWLTELKQSADCLDAVYFEEVRRHAGVDAAHLYGGFLAHLSAWCEHHAIPYHGVPVGTIKKHATGKGNASKADMVSAMRARGFEPVDDNEADALALLLWALAQEGVA